MTDHHQPKIINHEEGKCPICKNDLEAVWDNNAWDGEEGPRKDEITAWKCTYCGFTL